MRFDLAMMAKGLLPLFLALLAALPSASCQGQEAKEQTNLQQPKETLVANVREFGAKGDGKTDDTEAIEKAWTFAMDGKKPQFQHSRQDQRGYVTVNTTLYFPPGVYRYTGKGLEGEKGPRPQSWQLKGDGFNATRIEIESDAYFITCGRVESTIIEGISFVGGKGAFKSSWKSNMVGGRHIFRDCYFINYSECAIGNNANDSPYLSVSECIFQCKSGAEAIGIAWGGYLDDSQIANCAFERNAYHLKIGDRLSGSFQIGPRNSFISFGGTKTKADIWIVPNMEKSWGVNSGQGAIIGDNKFGNENFDPSAPRILIAPEDKASGEDRLSRKPDTSANDDQNMWLAGLRIKDNLVMGGGKPLRGFVYSCISNAGIIFDGNYFVGSGYPYLIEFAPALKRLKDHTPGNTTFVSSQQIDNKNWGAQGMDVSNFPGYAIPFDPDLSFAGRPEAPAVWQRDDDPGYLPLVSLTGIKMPVENAKSSAVEDAHGSNSAALVECASSSSALAVRIDSAKLLKEGKAGFIEVELKKAPKSSLENAMVWLAHDYGKSNERVCARIVELQDGWQRVVIPFVVRNLDSASFFLVVKPSGFAEGKSAFVCGNVRLYHAAAPHSGVRAGVKTLGDANAEIVFGRDPNAILVAGTLSAARTLKFTTLSPSVQPLPGFVYKISRPAGGEAKLDAGGAATLSSGEWCEIVYDGAAWQLMAKGSLK